MSEKALNLLSQAKYAEGLSGGIPQNIKIAQKFGEHINLTKTMIQPLSVELHNCGIVYLPNNPYILCIMTKGGTDENNSHLL